MQYWLREEASSATENIVWSNCNSFRGLREVLGMVVDKCFNFKFSVNVKISKYSLLKSANANTVEVFILVFF